MTTEVRVPYIGGLKDIEIIEVLSKAGDAIESEQGLFTLDTEFATFEVASPVAGTLVELTVGTGDRVSEGDLIARVKEAPQQESESPATVRKIAREYGVSLAKVKVARSTSMRNRQKNNLRAGGYVSDIIEIFPAIIMIIIMLCFMVFIFYIKVTTPISQPVEMSHEERVRQSDANFARRMANQAVEYAAAERAMNDYIGCIWEGKSLPLKRPVLTIGGEKKNYALNNRRECRKASGYKGSHEQAFAEAEARWDARKAATITEGELQQCIADADEITDPVEHFKAWRACTTKEVRK